MSVRVEKRIDEPGDSEHLELAWELKERIRREENVLKQRKGFFRNAYRRATSHLYFEDDELAGFASVRRDGYILFLAVTPEFRGQGYGERLVADVAANHRTVTCHARTTNENALEFYRHLGFDVDRHIRNYYEDGGDAYYLKLGDGGLTEKLSNLIRR
ncbi:Acetyltransferase (GNAT) family [Halalkaliarchaeum sp. AArc-CO]|uniref:GNAT family N-acetyltransferase n=1 Tax=unclassified Halalkaliarchaeum TaxID=2678344 RepID=UPI00217D6ECF|nr:MULTISPECIES: N-acetyltransferase [unclassified Halalkaliarchaeum]MDR5673838.1 N-acetyltransferase [Halalkaliarchaeum sp. AArc-GB]UWG50947.1 Acetyltransferase (GNAT) family [Halalkaliarchaeum sp. AArc-CO]